MPAITIIGPGRHGTAIGRLFASHGIDVTLYHHRAHKAQAAAKALRAVARSEVTVAPSLADAVADNEFIALTTLWDAPQRTVLDEIGDALVGRILVDVSNPLDVTPAGIIPRRPAQGSAGQFVATLLPAGVGHVKAFSNLPTATIEADADLDPIIALPFAADSADTAARVRPLFAATGRRPWLIGDISRSAEIEIGGRFNSAVGRRGRARLSTDEILQAFGPEAALAASAAGAAFGIR